MKDEEIKKLSEECALHYQGRPSNKGYELSNRLTIESYALMTLKWLSERYCIVPKEQLKELYACYKQHEAVCKEKGLYEAEMIARGSTSTMRDIFGEVMFEEEGK